MKIPIKQLTWCRTHKCLKNVRHYHNIIHGRPSLLCMTHLTHTECFPEFIPNDANCV